MKDREWGKEMGFENLSFVNKAAIVSIASQAYGSGTFEKTKGGAGHIGLLKSNGQERVIMFDTGGGASRNAEAIEASDRLRAKLLAIADNAGLDKDVMQQVRSKLGLEKGMDKPRFASLLDRKVVAQVATLIGGGALWAVVKAGICPPVPKGDGEDTFTKVAAERETGQEISNAEQHVRDMAWAEEQLNVFKAHLKDNDTDHYVKFVRNAGTGKCELADAGPRNIFRGSVAKRENDSVRAILYKALFLHYDGDIPESVQKELTNFDQGGHPLSTSRIGKIMTAMDNHDAIDGNNKIIVSDDVKNVNNGQQEEEIPPVLNDAVSSREINAKKFETEKAAADVFDEFVAFADRQGGSDRVYAKVFDGSGYDRGDVRLGVTQGEEKYKGRGEEEMETNNTARKMFYSSVNRMFKGKIPTSVRRVMTDDDYGGHPLSAKRILLIRDEVNSFLSTKFGDYGLQQQDVDNLKKVGLTLADMKNSLRTFVAKHKLEEQQETAYAKMIGPWLERRKDDGKLTAENADQIKTLLANGAPLMPADNFVGSVEGRPEPLVRVLTTATTSFKGLSGTIEYDSTIYPLWSCPNSEDAKKICDKTYDVIYDVIKDLPDSSMTKEMRDALQTCCLGDVGKFLAFYVSKDEIDKIGFRRRFWTDIDGKLHFRVSAELEGKTVAAHYEIKEDGSIELLNLGEDEKVDQGMRPLKTFLEPMTLTKGLALNDWNALKNPFSNRNQLSPKEEKARAIIEGSGEDDLSKPYKPSEYYKRISKPDLGENDDQDVDGAEYAQWLKENKGDQRGDWCYFYFGKGKQEAKSPYRHKLYLSIPRENVVGLQKSDLAEIYNAFENSKTEYPFEIKFLGDLRKWAKTTDHVCAYFSSQKDLETALDQFKRNKFVHVETGTDVLIAGEEYKVKDLDVNAEFKNLGGTCALSYTMILALRTWVAKVSKGCESLEAFNDRLAKDVQFNIAVNFLRKYDAGLIKPDSKDGLSSEKDQLLVANLNHFITMPKLLAE